MPTRIGRHLINLISPIVCVDRFTPTGVVVCEILLSQQAIILFAKFHNRPSNFAFIEGATSLCCDFLQSCPQCFVVDNFSRFGRVAVIGKYWACVWVLGETRIFTSETSGKVMTNGEAVLTERNCWFKRLL